MVRLRRQCIDLNGNGICDFEESGCTDPTACNYDSFAQVEDGSCDYCSCDYTDIDGYEANTSSVEGYNGVELEQTHLEGVLKACIRTVYIEMPSSDDVLSAISGDDDCLGVEHQHQLLPEPLRFGLGGTSAQP